MSNDCGDVDPKHAESVASPPSRHEDGTRKWTVAAGASSIGSAFLASACCIGPLILALLGIGGGALLAKFEPYRPYFMTITFVFLGTGFYFAYRKQKVLAVPGGANTTDGDDCGCPAPRSRRSGKVLLWVAMVVVVAFLAFPYAAPLIFR